MSSAAERNWQRLDRLKGFATVLFFLGIAIVLGCLLYAPMRAGLNTWIPVGMASFGMIGIWRFFEWRAFIQMRIEQGLSREEAKAEWRIRNPVNSD
ncbi:MAG: hypothetical protein ING72_04495 [Methylobacterium sp.]|nr:hypothetical protein [Methylobacterium sp.]MCA3604366.1 hypothetical protein [Methylobacterium sp.]MCA3615237.1 hypothetical protein [Methylobacterium sp.]MCA4909585.1 hypothetical protein [Methylobacterium sp.]